MVPIIIVSEGRFAGGPPPSGPAVPPPARPRAPRPAGGGSPYPTSANLDPAVSQYSGAISMPR